MRARHTVRMDGLGHEIIRARPAPQTKHFTFLSNRDQ